MSGTVGVAFLPLALSAVAAAVFVVADVRIVQKAGYSGWWMLVALVPVANVVMFLVFAFVTWPVTRELDAYRAATRVSYPSSSSQGLTGPPGAASSPLPPFPPGPSWVPPAGGAPQPPRPGTGSGPGSGPHGGVG